MKKSFQNFALTGCILILAFASCKKNSPPEPEKAKSETVKENVATELAKKAEVATFAEAFKNIVLTDDEVNEGLTILAPTNEALKDYRPRTSFSKNSIKLLADTNVEKLTQERLKDHIVKGILTKADFTHGKILISLSGKELKVTVEGDKISINGVELTLVSSSGSQMIYTIPEVLTNTESKIYLPVKLTSFINDTIIGSTTITYVGNTSLIASVEDDMFKEEFTYGQGELLKSIEYQKTGPNNWAQRNSYTYESNANGDIIRKNAMYGDTLLVGYWLINYGPTGKVTSTESYNVVKSVSTLDRKAEFEYDVVGNVKTTMITTYYGTTPSTSTYNYEHDNKNGVFKHVKNQPLFFIGNSKNVYHIINNIVKEVSGQGVTLWSTAYSEYNASGYPMKLTEQDPKSAVPPRTTIIEYDVK